MKKFIMGLLLIGGICFVAFVGLAAIAAFMNPEAYQQHVDDVADRTEEIKKRNAYLANFKLTSDEQTEWKDAVKGAIQQSYNNEAEVGSLYWERIDDDPNGDNVRYVIDKRIKVPNKMLKVKLRAILVVTYDGTDRDITLQFVNVDGKRIN